MSRFSFSAYHSANGQALSDDHIRRIAPSVFAEEAHESRSERYAYIPTSNVLQGLRAEGFEVFAAQQARTRLADRREHTKHLLRLRHRSNAELAMRPSVGDSVPEIVLINSHDGSSAYQMMAGVFRFVCANGLVVPASTVGDFRVPHTGQVRDRVIAGAFEILDGFTRVIEERETLQAITLEPEEQIIFARAALQLRYEDAAPVRPESVNQARRMDDRGADLWTTFNRVQENLIRGGRPGVNANGRRARTRAVEGIDQGVKLNRALWTLADEMRKLKA